jgi:colanic acid biosynthesis glycosyl transferase WcaI
VTAQFNPAPGAQDRLNILVVGINYTPEHTGIAPYTTQAARFLQESGHDVQVWTGLPHYPSWTVDKAYRKRRIDEVIDGVPVRRLWHYVPKRASALRRAVYEFSFGLHVATQRPTRKPDVVVVPVPSLAAATAGARLARKHDAKLVLWVQDLMGPAVSQSGMSGGKLIPGATRALEKSALLKADQVIVLNDAFRRYVEATGVPADRIHIVSNWTHVAAPTGDRQATRASLGWADDEVIALHSGNMGFKQGLENVVEAARLAAGSKVRFVLMGDGNQREHLTELGEGVGNLQFLPPADSAQFPDILAAADVLLVNERLSAFDMSLPSKLTSYFRCGRPVVAAVPAGGGTASEVVRSGGGILVQPEDPHALLDCVTSIGADPAEAMRLGTAGLDHMLRRLTPEASLGAINALLGGVAVVEERELTDS